MKITEEDQLKLSDKLDPEKEDYGWSDLSREH